MAASSGDSCRRLPEGRRGSTARERAEQAFDLGHFQADGALDLGLFVPRELTEEGAVAPDM